MDRFSWADPPKHTAFPIAAPGYPFIFAAAFATAVLALLGLTPLSLLGLLATFFICYFFRDPDRVIPQIDDAVVSPADGKVIAVRVRKDTPFKQGKCLQISIFMSVFNVHVNRIPYHGEVKGVRYQPGTFVAANKENAWQQNESNAVDLETKAGQRIVFVQVAGLIARRIICHVQAGDKVVRGQRFGMICFGSRLDVYLPAATQPKVAVGQTVKAGTSILGYLQ